MSEREDGFYWVKVRQKGEWEVASLKRGEWHVTDFEGEWDGSTMEIGPRVQRDSEVVRERDEAVAALRDIQTLTDYWKNLSDSRGSVSGRVDDLISRIEAENSGVTGVSFGVQRYPVGEEPRPISNRSVARIESQKSGGKP